MKILNFSLKKAATLTSLLLLAFAPAGHSVLLWDNGGGLNPDISSLSDVDGGSQSGDVFTLASAATLGQIEWSGLYASFGTAPQTDNFTIRLFELTGGTPKATPLYSLDIGNAVSRTNTGVKVAGFNSYAYSATLQNISLSAGSYLLSVRNNTTNEDDNWLWATNNAPGSFWFRWDGNSWSLRDRNLAFKISGSDGAATSLIASVADSGTNALLLSLGFVAIGIFRRGLRES